MALAEVVVSAQNGPVDLPRNPLRPGVSNSRLSESLQPPRHQPSHPSMKSRD